MLSVSSATVRIGRYIRPQTLSSIRNNCSGVESSDSSTGRKSEAERKISSDTPYWSSQNHLLESSPSLSSPQNEVPFPDIFIAFKNPGFPFNRDTPTDTTNTFVDVSRIIFIHSHDRTSPSYNFRPPYLTTERPVGREDIKDTPSSNGPKELAKRPASELVTLPKETPFSAVPIEFIPRLSRPQTETLALSREHFQDLANFVTRLENKHSKRDIDSNTK